MSDHDLVDADLRSRPRCPRCGGPVVRGPDPSSPAALIGTCVRCSYAFPLLPEAGADAAPAPAFPAVRGLFGFLVAGLLAGVLLAALSQLAIFGGILLIGLGLGLVIGVAALQAGYLPGVERWFRAFRRSRPHR